MGPDRSRCVMTKGAERQRAYQARQRERGREAVQFWLDADQLRLLEKLQARLGGDRNSVLEASFVALETWYEPRQSSAEITQPHQRRRQAYAQR